jgi:hypothetical protein
MCRVLIRGRTRSGRHAAFVAAALVLISDTAFAGAYYVDVETGAAFNGYNDVRIPPDTGTQFSFTEDLDAGATPFLRLRIGLMDSEKHKLIVFAAPLRFSAAGTPVTDIVFNGATFPAGIRLDGKYRFDSYRVTYLYGLHKSKRLAVDIGLTGKIRDAEISLSGGGLKSSYANTGFVPLFSFRVGWQAADHVCFLIEGDALASPGGEGRAEDIFLGLSHDTDGPLGFRLGYRFLEGGADVDDVYSFALIHYAAFGIRYHF